MAERQELSNLYAQLAAEHKKGFSDTKKCSDILEKLKVTNERFLLFLI